MLIQAHPFPRRALTENVLMDLSSSECPLISLDKAYHRDSITATLEVYPRLPEEPLSKLTLLLDTICTHSVTHLHLLHYGLLLSHMLCEKCKEAEEQCTLALCTFSVQADKCQAAASCESARVHIWSQTGGSESEWRTSFKNYSWIMAQLTFSFCSNQRLSCTYSPVFSVTELTSSSSFPPALFPVPLQSKKGAGLTLHTQMISTPGQNSQILDVRCDFLAEHPLPLFDLICSDDSVKDQLLD